MRFRGGGHKKAYRLVDFKRTKVDVCRPRSNVWNTIRTAPRLSRLLSIRRWRPRLISWRRSVWQSATLSIAGNYVDVKPGNVMPLGNMPIGTIVHNVEMKIGKGGQIARSAGTYAQIVGRDHDFVIVRLNSGEQRLVHGRCVGTIGAVSNPDHMNISIGKAGRTRWMGWQVRITAASSMNPIDHPHGGGEGRTSGGRHPVTPWGKPDQGQEDTF